MCDLSKGLVAIGVPARELGGVEGRSENGSCGAVVVG